METIQNLKKDKNIVTIAPVLFSEVKGIFTDVSERGLAQEYANVVNVYKITYKSQGHNVNGFIFEPKEGKSLPCLILNRGGSDDFGQITLEKLFTHHARFACAGYIVIASQYSGCGGSEGKDEFGGNDIEDVLNLYQILKSHPRANIKCIGMYGHSRGGMMTYRALALVKWIKAAVIISAPADEVHAPAFRKGWAEHQKKMYGGKRKEQIKRSVLYWSEKVYKKAPTLLMHGSADWRVNLRDSIRVSERFCVERVPHRFILFEGGDHTLSEYKSDVYEQSLDWFNRFVKNMEALPNLKPHGR